MGRRVLRPAITSSSYKKETSGCTHFWKPEHNICPLSLQCSTTIRLLSRRERRTTFLLACSSHFSIWGSSRPLDWITRQKQGLISPFTAHQRGKKGVYRVGFHFVSCTYESAFHVTDSWDWALLFPCVVLLTLACFSVWFALGGLSFACLPTLLLYLCPPSSLV